MKTKNILKLVVVTSLFTFSTSSCSDWLTVDMEDSIMETTLYQTNEGFLASLNGIYTKMNETYGSTLSLGVIDVMAQYYNVAKNSNHNYYVYANYKFSEDKFETMSSKVWTTTYNLIANLNTLLEHCDESGSALKPHYYPYVKGEALAFRALLHFDLLRIYGPIYNTASVSTITIPYQETTSKEIQPLLPASEVMSKIIRDLEAASTLLKDDRIRTEGVLDSDSSEDLNEKADLRYRQYRLNYFAVSSLLARAYLWTGNRAKAYEIAHNIITENTKSQVFPWTSKTDVQAKYPDRLFSTEVVFGLYNISRIKLFDSLFKSTASANSVLTFAGESMDADDQESKLSYFYSDLGDLRKGSNMWNLETLAEQNQTTGTATTIKALCFSKYADITTNKAYRYMIPLIRLSEVYLIAAECTDDLTEAIGYVNMIRKYRNCVDITLSETDGKEKVQEYITNEFAREVIGEGQLYFYYKRHAMGTILSGTAFGMWDTGYDQMPLQNYVWPLPKVERDKRITSK